MQQREVSKEWRDIRSDKQTDRQKGCAEVVVNSLWWVHEIDRCSMTGNHHFMLIAVKNKFIFLDIDYIVCSLAVSVRPFRLQLPRRKIRLSFFFLNQRMLQSHWSLYYQLTGFSGNIVWACIVLKQTSILLAAANKNVAPKNHPQLITFSLASFFFFLFFFV